MELLREIFTLYGERADWFGELLLAHMGLALAAIAMSGTISPGSATGPPSSP